MIISIFDKISDPWKVFIIRLFSDFEVFDLDSTYSIRRDIKLQLTRNVLEVVSISSLNAGQTEASH
jgi:hypothetical protein